MASSEDDDEAVEICKVLHEKMKKDFYSLLLQYLFGSSGLNWWKMENSFKNAGIVFV